MDDDRDLEGQELDATAVPRKRRAARGVRVPNDPVPETKKSESLFRVVAEAPKDEFFDRPTQLFAEGSAPTLHSENPEDTDSVPVGPVARAGHPHPCGGSARSDAALGRQTR